MERIITTQDLLLYKQHSLPIYLKINLMNTNRQIIDSMESVVTSCSTQIDASSAIRRTANMNFYVKNNTYFTSPNSRIWLNKLVKIYVGYMYFKTNEIIWYDLGTYIFGNTDFSYNATDKSGSVSCSDLMATLNGDRGGKINASSIVIPAESIIRDAIISIITQNGNVTDYYVESVPDTIPYDLDFSNGSTVYDITSKIQGLYPSYEQFFDDFIYTYQSIPSCENDPNFVDYTFFDGLVTDEKSTIDLNSVKNVVTVWGSNGLNATWKDQNPDSPYYVEDIGEYEEILSGGDYDNITTQDQCDERAAYEGWLRTRLNDGCTIEMLAIPWMNVNKKFTYKSLMTGEINTYISKNISMDIMSGVMTMNMSRFYSEYPDILQTDFIEHLY